MSQYEEEKHKVNVYIRKLLEAEYWRQICQWKTPTIKSASEYEK